MADVGASGHSMLGLDFNKQDLQAFYDGEISLELAIFNHSRGSHSTTASIGLL